MPSRPKPVRRPSARPARRAAAHVDPRDLPGILAATGSVYWVGNGSAEAAAQISPPNHPVLSRLGRARRWIEAIHAGDRERVGAFFAAITAADLPTAIEYRLDAPESTWVRHTIVALTGANHTRRTTGVVTDITHARALASSTLEISEREKNRIGQDLHDDLCQVLAGLSCLTRVLENRLAPKLPDEVPTLREINAQLVDAMNRTRALTHGLFPAKMRSGDLRAALQELARQTEVRFGVKVLPRFRGRLVEHAPQSVLQVYRITQEAITNAIKHGRATAIDVAVECRNGFMELAIRDNGTGMAAAPSAGGGIGVHIMRRRANLLGGELTIRNAPRKGVIIKVTYQPTLSP